MTVKTAAAPDPFDVATLQDEQAEMCVLGGMMLTETVLREVMATVKADDFATPANQAIFSALVELSCTDTPVDAVTASGYMRETGDLARVGGANYLGACLDACLVASSAVFYARIVAGRALARRLGEAAVRVHQIASGPGEARENYARAMFEMERAGRGADLGHNPVRDGFDLANEWHQAMDAPDLTGVMFGFADLDTLTGGMGMLPGNTYLVAAPSGGFKSTFAGTIARHAAVQQRKRVLFVSLEMSTLSVFQRLVSAQAGVDFARVRARHFTAGEQARVDLAVETLGDSGLHVTEDASATPEKIRGWAKGMIAGGGLDLVVVDYLQLMPEAPGSGTREQKVAEMSRKLKLMSKDLGVAVLILSQMNRAIYQRPLRDDDSPARAMLSDIRESAALVNDASMVIFLSNPAGLAEGGQHPRAGQLGVQVEKNREGRNGDFVVACVGRVQLITDLKGADEQADADRERTEFDEATAMRLARSGL